MKFNTIYELADYLMESDLKMSDIDVNVVEDITDSVETERVDCDVNEHLIESVTVKSLASNPSINFEICESSEVNKIYVSKFDVIKNACGTGNIKLDESLVYLNICDFEGKSSTKMNLTINETEYSNVELFIEESTDERIVLSKQWIDANIS